MAFKILLVNDDGFMTRGLPLMYNSLKEVGDVLAIVPEIPKSGGGHSLTLHKPLFVRSINMYNFEIKVVNGTPVDAFHAALKIFNYKPDIVFSGVNIGENTSMQNILYSGTVQAAVEAGLFGYPSVAISADVGSDEEFERPDYSFMIRLVVKTVAKYFLENGWIEGIDTLSINLPKTPNPISAILPEKTQRIRFQQRFERRVDPRGREYYWLVGDRVTEDKTDTFYLENGYITLTPLKANMSCEGDCSYTAVVRKLQPLIALLNNILGRLRKYGGS